MKKVIIFVDSLMRGGAERVSVYLADYFVKHGLACQIVTQRKGEKEYALPEGVERTVLSGKGIPQKILALRKVLLHAQADVMLVMGTPFCGITIPAAMGTKTKVIVSERNDPRHCLAKKSTRIVAQTLIPLANGFVFQTEDAKKYYDKKLRGRGCVIFNPLLADNLPDRWQGERRKEIVTMGRMVLQKNHKLLLDAFGKVAQEYPDHSLTIYGDGPLRQQLQDQIDSMGLRDRVSLPGNMPDVLSRIQSAALFVMSSDFEGMPNALIEAMAIGLPCISTDCPCGGPQELITSGENGVLVPVGDAAALAAAMKDMLADSGKAEAMAQQAMTVRQKLHVDGIGKQWMDYLSRIVNS